ncbi:hypothetical protein SRHO_G00206840 [Serrasalmus rhombeus]
MAHYGTFTSELCRSGAGRRSLEDSYQTLQRGFMDATFSLSQQRFLNWYQLEARVIHSPVEQDFMMSAGEITRCTLNGDLVQDFAL